MISKNWGTTRHVLSSLRAKSSDANYENCDGVNVLCVAATESLR